MTLTYRERTAPVALPPVMSFLGNEPAGLAVDFVNMTAVVRDPITAANNFYGDPNSLFTYSSPGTKRLLNASGAYVTGTTLRNDYDASGAPLGLLVEPQRTNSIRNNSMQGAVAGTPGTPPTNWTMGTANGISREILGLGGGR